jgi:predicted transcriptional regulator
MKIKIAARVLLALADLFEHGNVKWQEIAQESVEEYEDFKQRYATLVAEGLLRIRVGFLYQFTDEGYLMYSDQIKALRALGTS